MEDKITINLLEVENVKRVKAVRIVPNENGLTIMAGNNNQGKTSVLDAIAFALGGAKFKPSNLAREGSNTNPYMKVELSNGIIVERGGVNSTLKVIDPTGNKGGQGLLDSFLNELSLNIPKFIAQTSKEKARTLLEIIGVGDKLFHMDAAEEKLFTERTGIGSIQKQKENYAKELAHYSDAPSEPVSASELIKQQQEILSRNGDNNRKRQNVSFIETQNANLLSERARLIESLKALDEKIAASNTDLEIARKSALDLHDESTDELENSINNIEAINTKVRANMDREKAIDEASAYKLKYDELTAQIVKVRADKLELLNGAQLPLEGLSVENSELTYLGKKWDAMSGSQQLQVATAIVRRINPTCGFVLLDKLEQFDAVQLEEFGKWLSSEGLQAIGTRVGSSGGVNEIIIEDGYVKGQSVSFVQPTEEVVEKEVQPSALPTW